MFKKTYKNFFVVFLKKFKTLKITIFFKSRIIINIGFGTLAVYLILLTSTLKYIDHNNIMQFNYGPKVIN